MVYRHTSSCFSCFPVWRKSEGRFELERRRWQRSLPRWKTWRLNVKSESVQCFAECLSIRTLSGTWDCAQSAGYLCFLKWITKIKMCSARARLWFWYKTCTLQSWPENTWAGEKNQILEHRTCPPIRKREIKRIQILRKQKWGKRKEKEEQGAEQESRTVADVWPWFFFVHKFQYDSFCCKHPVRWHSFSWYMVSCFRFRRDCAFAIL